MTRALLGWELGGGQGHIHRLAAIARSLCSYGIEPIFALKNFHPKGLDFPWKVLQAPLSPMKAIEESDRDHKSYLFTDILHIYGFRHPDLHFHIKAWKNLIALVKPTFVIAEFAPALVLASRSLSVPVIVTGNSFSVPPPVIDFPALRESVPIASRCRQSEVSEVVYQVTGFDAPLGQLLNGDRSFIFSIPELDFYRDVRHGAEYVGMHNAPFPQNIGDEHGSFWSYLSTDWPHYQLVMNKLQPDNKFGALENVLKGKSLAIHHGGSTTTTACLLMGIPQLLLPKHLEQWLNASALARLGVAQIITHPTAESLKTSVMSTLFHKASEQAQRFSSWNHNRIDQVVQSCLSCFL